MSEAPDSSSTNLGGPGVVFAIILTLLIPAFLTLRTVTSPGVLVMTSDNPTPLGYTWSLTLWLIPLLAIVWWLHAHPRFAIPRALLAPGATGEAVWQALADRYRGEPFVEVAAFRGLEPVDDFLLDPTALNGTNRLRLHALPNAAGHVLLVGLLDNLGKGASGAAIQSLNLMLGLDETTGLPR